jgi:hypothetical protein
LDRSVIEAVSASITEGSAYWIDFSMVDTVGEYVSARKFPNIGTGNESVFV